MPPPSAPTPHGKHAYVTLEREDATTRECQERLAKLFGLARADDVGVAGLKDRCARATQAFSLPRDLLPRELRGEDGAALLRQRLSDASAELRMRVAGRATQCALPHRAPSTRGTAESSCTLCGTGGRRGRVAREEAEARGAPGQPLPTGPLRPTRSYLGRWYLGRSELGRSDLGRSYLGRSYLGRRRSLARAGGGGVASDIGLGQLLWAAAAGQERRDGRPRVGAAREHRFARRRRRRRRRAEAQAEGALAGRARAERVPGVHAYRIPSICMGV